MKILIHIEQYDVVGVLPSQLEHIALLANAMGVSKVGYIDKTPDGFSHVAGTTKYSNLAQFFATETGPFIALVPDSGNDIRTLSVTADTWLLFGPAMGWVADDFTGQTLGWATVPGGVMSSRDVISIAVWETSEWRAP